MYMNLVTDREELLPSFLHPRTTTLYTDVHRFYGERTPTSKHDNIAVYLYRAIHQACSSPFYNSIMNLSRLLFLERFFTWKPYFQIIETVACATTVVGTGEWLAAIQPSDF